MEDAIPLNIILVGEERVGKSTLIRNFVGDKGNIVQTENAVSFGSKVMSINDGYARFNVINNGSTTTFESQIIVIANRQYNITQNNSSTEFESKIEEIANKQIPKFNYLDAIVMVCDKTNPDSFTSLDKKWEGFVRGLHPKSIKAIVMTKKKAKVKKEVDEQVFDAYGKKFGYLTEKLDPEDTNAVNKLFKKIAKKIEKNIKSNAKKLNIVLVGEGKVGKKTIIKSFLGGYSNQFLAPKLNELGDIGFAYKEFKDPNGNIYDALKISIYSNPSADEKFSALKNIIKLEDINVVILVCDLSSKKSFSKIKDKWYKKVKSNFTNAYMVIAENKSDLYNNEDLKEKIDDEKIEKFANKKGILFYQCSAQDNDGIELLFKDIVEKFIEEPKKNKASKEKESGFGWGCGFCA